MNLTHEHLAELEEVLLHELRVCQAIQYLIEEERRVMTSGNVDGLLAVIEQKKNYLDEIGDLEEKCRLIVQDLAEISGVSSPSITLADLFPALQSDEADRLGRLRGRILEALREIRDMTYGNRALANSALKRVDSFQTFLLNLLQPTANYSVPGGQTAPGSTISWDVDQRA
jgi:flagellar biosynthesis/type III secretory pathway chaperone